MKIEKLENNKVKFDVEVTAEEFKKALEDTFKVENENVTLPGFRKGKAPMSAFVKKFGIEVLYEGAVNQSMSLKYSKVIEENNIDVVAQPKIDFDFSTVEEGKGYTFTATVAVKPEVTLGDYKGIEIKAHDTEAKDAEINREIEKLLFSEVAFEPKDGAIEAGDQAIFDFVGTVDGEEFEGGSASNYELIVSSGSFIPGFEEQMLGLKSGDEKDVNVTFPEDYHATDLAGKPAVFKVTIHDVKSRELPEVTEEIVTKLGYENVTTHEQLKTFVKNRIVEIKENNAYDRMVDEAVEIASQNATIDIPTEMIDSEKKRLKENVEKQASQYNMSLEMFIAMTGGNPEKFDGELTKNAEKRVRYNLTLEAIIKAENITPTEEDIDKKYAELAEQYQIPVSSAKQFMAVDMVSEDCKYDLAAKFIVDNATKK